MKRLCIALAVCLAVATAAWAQQKIVTLKSGTQLTGEVRRNDDAWREAARAYSEAKEAIRRARAEAGLAKLEKAEKAAKERLLELAEPEGMIKTSGFGVTVTPYETKAYSVDASVKRRVAGSFEDPGA